MPTSVADMLAVLAYAKDLLLGVLGVVIMIKNILKEVKEVVGMIEELAVAVRGLFQVWAQGFRWVWAQGLQQLQWTQWLQQVQWAQWLQQVQWAKSTRYQGISQAFILFIFQWRLAIKTKIHLINLFEGCAFYSSETMINGIHTENGVPRVTLPN